MRFIGRLLASGSASALVFWGSIASSQVPPGKDAPEEGSEGGDEPPEDSGSTEDAGSPAPDETRDLKSPPARESEQDTNQQGPDSPKEAAEAVIPPRVLEEAPVQPPSGSTAGGRVELEVTIGPDGRASDIRVRASVSEEVDSAAIESLKAWRFAPAERGGQKIAARIVVAIDVAPPVVPPQSAPVAAVKSPPAQEVEAPREEEHDHAADDVHMQVTVHGERPLRTQRRSASDYFIHREVLEAAPHQEGAEVLRAVPGLTTFRTEGLAVAHSYSLRGFDADHGQDIEFMVGGLPINLPSHIHGQGYSDLGFLIGEVVDEVAVSAGVSDPRQGDFAVAGSVRVGLGVDEERRGLQVRSGYGSFHSQRHQFIWAPKEGERESLGAAQYSTTRGYGDNRGGKSASGIVQHRFGQGKISYRTLGLVHAARADSAGVVRRDDIDSGEVCFHCAYPDATARGQNATSQRLMAGLFADYRGPAHANGTFGFFAGRDHFVSRQNFTGYLESSRLLPGVSGRGDLIEQRNTTGTFGVTGRYRTEAFEPVKWAHGTLEVGVDGRFDSIDQAQSLLDATVRNQTWDQRVDATIRAIDMGLWGDLDWQLGSRIHARVGLRAAVLSYDVDDRLGNFAPLTRPQDQSLSGFRRTAMGASVGPRTSVDYKATEWLWVLGSYGEGYRSPQARTLQEGENAPFAKVRSGDGGVRLRFGDPLEVSATGFYTHLSSDVAFDASEGRLERIGPTRRLGGVGYVVTRPTDWLLGSLSVTYVSATLLEPPPATAEEPNPPFQAGQPLPFVPPLVVRLDASAKAPLFRPEEGRPLIGRLGLGATYLAPRPLPYGERARPVPLLDASGALLYGPFDLTLSAFNLLDLDYSAREYFFVSDWDPGQNPSRVPARHIAAGPPLTLFLALGVTL